MNSNMPLMNSKQLKYEYEKYTFKRKYKKAFNIKCKQKNEIRLFAISRNESLRLPYFLEYYFNMGVDRMFIIDNDSKDNSNEIFKKYENIHVIKIQESYQNHWIWMEYLLEKFGINRWCVVVDIDELFAYPYSDCGLNLIDLISYLEKRRYTAVSSILLDMYSNSPILKACYSQGTDPLIICPFFDSSIDGLTWNFFDKKRWKVFEAKDFRGGMRERVFSVNNERLPYRLSKISLFYYNKNTYLTQGMHAINGACIADIQGVVFHTKFLSDFVHEVQIEAEREEHFSNAIMYKIFYEKLLEHPDLNLHYKYSVKYKDSSQMINLGIMKTSKDFECFLVKNCEIHNT